MELIEKKNTGKDKQKKEVVEGKRVKSRKREALNKKR